MKDNLTLFDVSDYEVLPVNSPEKLNQFVQQRNINLSQNSKQIKGTNTLMHFEESTDSACKFQAKSLADVENKYPNPLSEETILSLLQEAHYLQFLQNPDLSPTQKLPVNSLSLSINLYSYVQNPFTDDADFDMILFRNHVQIAVRLLDDYLDIESTFLDDFKNASQKCITSDLLTAVQNRKNDILEKRQISFCTCSLENLLASLNIEYASDHCNAFVAEIHRQLALAAYHSSVTLARERGAFHSYSSVNDIKNPFIYKIKDSDEKLYDEMAFFGRRNLSLLSYTQSDINNSQFFADISPNEIILNPKFILWAENNGVSQMEIHKMNYTEIVDLIAKSPYAPIDCDILKLMNMQESIQNWLD